MSESHAIEVVVGIGALVRAGEVVLRRRPEQDRSGVRIGKYLVKTGEHREGTNTEAEFDAALAGADDTSGAEIQEEIGPKEIDASAADEADGAEAEPEVEAVPEAPPPPLVESYSAERSGYVVFAGNEYSIQPVVSIVADGLCALLHFPADAARIEWTYGLVQELMAEAGVVFGIKEDAIAEFIEAAEAGREPPPSEPPEGVDLPLPPDSSVIARGKAMIRGPNSRLHFYIDSETVAGAQLSHDRMDFKKQQVMVPVKAGDILAVKVPAGAGSPGCKVTSEPIPAVPGRDVPFAPGQNVKLLEDKRTYVANIAGVALQNGERIDVVSSLSVPGDVGYATGSLECTAGVEVRGSVLTAFKIRAHGDVTVGDTVEDAIIESRGNVIVRGGISQGHMGSVTAHGSIQSRFAQSAELQSGTSITIQDSVVNSFLVAAGAIEITGGRGTMVGGRAVAGQRIELKVAGSRADVRTILQVGIPYKALQPVERKLRTLEGRMAELAERCGERFMELLEMEPPKIKDKNIRLRIEKWKTLSVTRSELIEAREKILRDHHGHVGHEAAIAITSRVFPNVVIMIGNKTREIHEPLGPTTFIWDASASDITIKK